MSEMYPRKIEELPDKEFFAILTQESVTIPGDERSRTNPGHGYPESTENYWSIQTFSDRDAWLAKIKQLTTATYPSKFKAVIMKPVKVTTDVVVDVLE